MAWGTRSGGHHHRTSTHTPTHRSSGHHHKGHKGPHPGAKGKHHPHKGVHEHHAHHSTPPAGG